MKYYSAYGPDSERWLSRFSEESAVCSFDFGFGREAIYDIVARRRRGNAFWASVFLPPSRLALFMRIASPVFGQTSNYDDRISYLDAFDAEVLSIDGKPQQAFSGYDPDELAISRDALKVADRVLFRSWTECHRICETLRWRPPSFSVASAPVAFALATQSCGTPAGSIVLWGTDSSPDVTRVIAFVLRGELNLPILVVAGEAIPGEATVRPDEISESDLRSAALIVDLTPYDPSVAGFLCAYARPLLTTITSGADELCEGVVCFDPTSRKSVVKAAATALGVSAPRIGPSAARRTDRALIVEPHAESAAGPLVSVVVPTYNRAKDLVTTLKSVVAQTYENIEVIVVNDAGEPIERAVSAFDGVRVINREKNGGLAAARNTGIRAARGKYVATIDDDDFFFPDHVTSLVRALENSGQSFARSHSITRYVETSEDGSQHTFSYRMEFDVYASLSDLLVNNHFNAMLVLIRRDAFDACGLFDETMPSSEDYEMWLRLAQRYPVVYVDRVTAEYTRLADRSAMTFRLRERRIEAFTRIYQKHPVGDRPAIEARRRQTLDWWRAQDGVAFAPPLFRMDRPEVTARVDQLPVFGAG